MEKLKLFGLCLLLAGCSHIAEKDRNLFEINDRETADTIRIDYADEFNSSDIVEDIRLITLDHNSELLIGQIDKLLFSSDRMVIMDEMTSKIFCFDLNGNIVFEIDQQGIGPGQYRELSDISINQTLYQLDVLDRQGQNVLTFDLKSGEFISSAPFLFFAATFANLNDSLRVFHTSNYPNQDFFKDDQYAKTVYVTDFKNDIRSKNFDFKRGLDKIRLVTKWNLFRSYDNEKLYYVPLYDNRVYQIGSNTFDLSYVVDFGEYTMPNSFLPSFSGPPAEWTKVIIESGFAFDLTNFIESEKFITFRSTVKGGPLYTIYDKTSGSSLSYKLLTDDVGAFQIHPIASYEDYFVTVVSRRSLNRKVSAIRGSSSSVSKRFLDELEGAILEGGEDEFPVLIMVKFKNIDK